MNPIQVAAVVGAGPGTGLAVAKRFAAGGYHVALMARDASKLESAAQGLRDSKLHATAISCDCGDEASVEAAFKQAKAIGSLEVLVFNPAAGFPSFPLPKFADLPVSQLQTSLQINVIGAFLCSQQVVPHMLSNKKGTIIFTGATASLRGGAGFASFAAGKFGLRAVAQSMARELQPQGIHVAHVILDGVIKSERTMSMMPNKPEDSFLSPEAIAEAYWSLHTQDRSAWTQELEVRPFNEKF